MTTPERRPHQPQVADGVSGSISVPRQEGIKRKRGSAAGIGTALPSHVTDPTAAATLSAEQRKQLADRRAGKIGSIHSWELVTAVDGPGTRLTIFLNGCPLRCQYCHNPDTFKIRDGQFHKVDDVLARLARYRTVFQATGGGLTLSGGEPLFQAAFTRRLLHGAKELGVHTCIDTSGYLGRHCDDDMLADIDLVLLDMKSGLPDTYRTVTTRELQPTIEFGNRLAAAGKPVWVRFVLVPGLTDAPDNVEAVAQLVSQWPNVERVEVLPFHNMGADKWQELGLDYQLADTETPSKELVEATRARFRAHGLTVY